MSLTPVPRSLPPLRCDLRSDELLDLLDGREAVLLLLRERKIAVDNDLEDPAEGWNELQLRDVLPELIEHRLRQAHGLGKVVSHAAVFDGKVDPVRWVQGRSSSGQLSADHNSNEAHCVPRRAGTPGDGEGARE
mgnify:CR=1 FL=1